MVEISEANAFFDRLAADRGVDCPPPRTTARLLDKVCLTYLHMYEAGLTCSWHVCLFSFVKTHKGQLVLIFVVSACNCSLWVLALDSGHAAMSRPLSKSNQIVYFV